MAGKGMIETNLRRMRLVKRYAPKREALKAIIANTNLPFEERFAAQIKLASLPRNASRVRVKNRCMVTGRGRGYMGAFQMSRIAFRDLASFGLLPGVTKASW